MAYANVTGRISGHMSSDWTTDWTMSLLPTCDHIPTHNKTLLISNNESVWIVACFCLSVCPFVWAFFVHPCVLVLCEKSGTCARAWSGNSIWLAGHSYSFWHLSIFSFVKVSSWWLKIEREGLEWIDLSECKSYRLLQSQPLIRS